MCGNSGPLLALDFFDVNLLKHCTLHILNLGLLGVSNGSALQLGSTCGFRNWNIRIDGATFAFDYFLGSHLENKKTSNYRLIVWQILWTVNF